MNLYKLTIPSFTQFKYAWAEFPENVNISDQFPKCPKCGRAIGQRYWLPPHNIIIKQPKEIGDFVGGIVGVDLIVSQNFKNKYEQSSLKGIQNFMELNVVKMGTKNNSSYTIPKLFGATINITQTQVDYDKMGVTWFDEPADNICKLCSPGGGGEGGIYQSYDRIVINERHPIDFDFFIPINFVGNILITEKAKEFIIKNNFKNIKLTSIEMAKHDIFQIDA